MKYLFRKLLRDIRFSAGQYIATTLVIMLGVAFYVGMMSASAGVKQNIDEFYASQKLADLWVTVPNADESVVSRIRDVPGVEAADGRALLTGSSGTNEFVIHTIPDEPTVNIPFMESGQLSRSADECIIDRGYAAANNLTAGSVIDVSINNAAYRLTISGVFNSPEYLYLAKDITAQPDHKNYGALFISESLIQGLPVNEIVVKATPDADIAALRAKITQIAGAEGASVILGREQLFSWVMLTNDITQFGQLGAVFPVIFFLVAAAIIFISMSKNVEIQRNQIGNMKALGIRGGMITFHFLSYTLLTCLIGCILGAVAGVFALMPSIQMIFTTFYTMPVLHPRGFTGDIAVASVLAFAFGILATIISVRRPLRESPASAMRPKAPRNIKPILLERSDRLWSKLSFGRKIVLRNLFLNKGRALLSSIGIIGCVGLLLASFAFMDCINNILDTKFYQMNRYDVSVTLKTPVSPDDTFPLMNGEIAAAWGQASIPASFNAGGGIVSANLTALDAGCDAIALYDRGGKLPSFPKDGVIIPKLYAGKYKLAPGDTLKLTLSPIGGAPQSVDVKIAGIALEYLEQDMYTSYDYLREIGVAAPVSTFYLQISNGADASGVAAALDQEAAVGKAITKDEMANAWSQELNLMNSLIFIMIAASAVLALTVVYNISAINILERRRDIATLKVLGYHRKEVNKLVFQENLLITGFGSLLGLAAGVGMLWLIINAVVSDTMMVPMVITPLSVVYAIVLGFVFTALANQLLRKKIKRIDMVESLKSVE